MWLATLIGAVVEEDEAVVTSKAKAGSRPLPPLFEPHAVVLPELLAAMGGECLVQHARSILPTRLRLGRGHAHGIHAYIRWQICAQRLPPARPPRAERPLPAGHDPEEAHHPRGVSPA